MEEDLLDLSDLFRAQWSPAIFIFFASLHLLKQFFCILDMRQIVAKFFLLKENLDFMKIW